ncbi:ZN574 protein, partial [Dicaeum eximium]|nr:ZN574 protein [Dicaeum eximium]
LFQSQELWLAHRQGHRNPPNPPQNHARVDVEHSYRKPEEENGGNAEISAQNAAPNAGQNAATNAGQNAATNAGQPETSALQLLLYECGECLQLFQSPKDFLEHQ